MSEAFKFSLSGCGDVGWLKFDAAKADKTPSMRQSLRSVRNAHHSTESYKTKSAQREHSPRADVGSGIGLLASESDQHPNRFGAIVERTSERRDRPLWPVNRLPLRTAAKSLEGGTEGRPQPDQAECLGIIILRPDPILGFQKTLHEGRMTEQVDVSDRTELHLGNRERTELPVFTS